MFLNSIIVVVVVIAIIIILLVISRKINSGAIKKTEEVVRHCPVCGSDLKSGERVHSESVSLEDSKILYIYGCKYCYKSKTGIKRVCPVCKKRLLKKGYLLAKMWQEGTKTRVHVSGCNSCVL